MTAFSLEVAHDHCAGVARYRRDPRRGPRQINPSGQCQAYLPYGQEGVLVQAIKVEDATGLLASRYAPERYQDFTVE